MAHECVVNHIPTGLALRSPCPVACLYSWRGLCLWGAVFRAVGHIKRFRCREVWVKLLRNCVLTVEYWETFLRGRQAQGRVFCWCGYSGESQSVLYRYFREVSMLLVLPPPRCLSFSVVIKLLLLNPGMTAACKASFCMTTLCWVILENCFPEAVCSWRLFRPFYMCPIGFDLCSSLDISAPLHLPSGLVWYLSECSSVLFVLFQVSSPRLSSLSKTRLLPLSQP